VQIVASNPVDDAVKGESDADAEKVIATSRHVTFDDEQGETRRSTRTRYPKDRYEAGTSGMESYVTKDDDNDEEQEEDQDQGQEEEDDDSDETEMSAWLLLK
jgi:hypothetical protein